MISKVTRRPSSLARPRTWSWLAAGLVLVPALAINGCGGSAAADSGGLGGAGNDSDGTGGSADATGGSTTATGGNSAEGGAGGATNPDCDSVQGDACCEGRTCGEGVCIGFGDAVCETECGADGQDCCEGGGPGSACVQGALCNGGTCEAFEVPTDCGTVGLACCEFGPNNGCFGPGIECNADSECEATP